MSTPYEPSDVGPAAGGDQSVAETDREHVITMLTAAANEGRLSVSERDRRLGLARAAVTFDDLVPLTRDLVNLDAVPQWSTLPPSNLVSPTPGSDQAQDTETLVAVFSAASRRGQWRVPGNVWSFTCFGGAKIDLSEAIFTAKEVHIKVVNIFGGCDIVVPPGVDVRDATISIFGGTDAKKLRPSQPDAPVIYLHGFNCFGGTDIKHPKQ
ncbi:MAG: DUF1707 domain-containing protein [Propionibacteriaceae bacterium]|nr:DUF1707 domain-containing protein [Propionibacteriaceae bacterium]